MKTRLLVAATLVTALAAASAGQLLFETDDAVVIEAADWGDRLWTRHRRQLTSSPDPDPDLSSDRDLRADPDTRKAQTVVPPGWPGLPAGVTDKCSTPDGRSGRCLPRTVCYWTRRLTSADLATAERRLAGCAARGGRGPPSVRTVCCPGLFAEARPSTSPLPTTTTPRFTTPARTTRRIPEVTYWWQTTDDPNRKPVTETTPRPITPTTTKPATTTKKPTTARRTTTRRTTTKRTTTRRTTTRRSTTRRTTARRTTTKRATTSERTTTSRRPLPSLPTIPPIITHPWQASSTTPAMQQTTGWWEATSAATEATSATTGAPSAATTAWWQTTRRTTATTPWWQTTRSSTATPAAATSSTTQAPNVDAQGVSFSECGTRSREADRIVGGGEAVKGEFPWMAAIFKGSRQFCGGSLIDQTHILTAAHCVAHMTPYDVRRLVVRLGDHDIHTSREADHDEYKVARVIRHKTFSEQTLHKDIALLTLNKNVTYKSNIRPVCLAEGSQRYTGQSVTVAGWGTLSEAGRQPSQLQKVNLTVWANKKCAKSYGSSAPGGIISSMLCAGDPNKDSCRGDSGGPLMSVGRKVTQVGVVSWGIGCAKPQYPGVYTRVNDLRDWIDRNREVF